MSKYLVTGASGFVGRYLVELLAERGHDVFGVVRTKGKLQDLPATELIADLVSTGAITKEVVRLQPDGIFHLAAPQTSVGHSWQAPAETLEANLQSTLSVLEAARAASTPPRVLFVSSAEVLGPVPEDRQPVAEGEPPCPNNPYGLSKLMGEGVVTLYHRHFGVPGLIVRPFNHIGPGQRDSFVVPSFAKQVAAAERQGGGEIKVGNLSARRDFSDVRDMVAAYLAVMEQGQPGEAYHAASGDVRSVDDIARFLAGAATAKITIVTDPARVRPNDIPLLAGDAAKLRGLGWQPKIPLEQTMQEILDAARAAVTKKATH